MKIYNAELYRVNYFKSEVSGSLRAVAVPIGKVIVQKKLMSVKELLTGYSKINIIPIGALSKIGGSFRSLDVNYWNRAKVMREGEHLFVISNDLKPQNFATEEDINQYVEGFDSSKWKSVYERMKKMNQKEKDQSYQKARQVMGTKR